MRDRRLTLRTSMGVIVAWGALLAWVRSQRSVDAALSAASGSSIAWAVSFLATFALARKVGPTVRGLGGRSTVSVLLAIVLAAMLYLVWAQYRALDFIHGLDLDFPYPDPWINRLERWFDARHPAHGGLKLHGEYYRVAVVLGMLILVFAGATGILIGLLWNRPEVAEGGERGCSGPI
jgi:hypothetical protein